MTNQPPTPSYLWHVKPHECVACGGRLSIDSFERYYRAGVTNDPNTIDLVCGSCHEGLEGPSPARAQTEAALVDIEEAMPDAARAEVIREYLGRSSFVWKLGS